MTYAIESADAIYGAALAAIFATAPTLSYAVAFTALAAAAPDVASGIAPHTDADIVAAIATTNIA